MPAPRPDPRPPSPGDDAPLDTRVVLLRALRLRCPKCGVGDVYPPRSFVRADGCDACGWRFERCEGHWIGGSEINMLLTFPFGVAVAGTLSLAFGLGAVTIALTCAIVIAFSVAIQRPSRSVFVAVDYLCDSAPDPHSGRFGGFGGWGGSGGSDDDPDGRDGSDEPDDRRTAADRGDPPAEAPPLPPSPLRAPVPTRPTAPSRPARTAPRPTPRPEPVARATR